MPRPPIRPAGELIDALDGSTAEKRSIDGLWLAAIAGGLILERLCAIAVGPQ